MKMEITIPFKFRLGKGGYRSKWDGLDRVQQGVENLLKGEIAESLSICINPEAYAVIGSRYEHLSSLLTEKSKLGLLEDGPGSKVVFSNTIIDDAEDAAYMVIKNQPANGKSARFHTIVFMKGADGRWTIRTWHVSP